jgi:hypothetical protein
VNTEPERTTGTRCNTPISGGILSFPCTLAANHEANGEPHYAVEVDRSVRAWRTWKEQTLMAQQASDAEGQQVPVGGVIEELPGGVTISRTTDTETIHPMVVNLRPEPTKQREGDQRLPDGDETVVDDQALLIADIEARRQVGIARYGQGHRPFNGRDTLLDAYEEMLDFLVYLRSLRRAAQADRQTLVEVVEKVISEQPRAASSQALAEVAVDRVMGWVVGQRDHEVDQMIVSLAQAGVDVRQRPDGQWEASVIPDAG